MPELKMLKVAEDYVAENWNAFRPMIEASLPPVASSSPNRMERILEAIINQTLDCYAIYNEDEEERRTLLAVMTVMVCNQIDSEDGDFLIYSLTGTQRLNIMSGWVEGMQTLRNIARSRGCSRVLIFSNEPGILRFLETLGADTSFHVVTLPV